MTSATWIALGVVWLALVVIDLRPWTAHRRVSVRRAVAWSALWLAVGFGFTLAIHHYYGDGLHNLTRAPEGQLAATQYITVFVIQKSLTIGNVLMAALIFASMRLAVAQQQRVLMIGAAALIIARLAVLAGGTALAARWEPIVPLSGFVLFVVAARLLVARHDNLSPDHNVAALMLRRLYPVDPDPDAHQFFIPGVDHFALTALSLALLCLVTTNLWFAAATLPGAAAISDEPLILWPATLASLMGLRSLYELLAALMHRLNYLKSSLAFLLGFAGVNAVLVLDAPIPPAVCLAVLVGMLAVGVLATLLGGTRDTAPLKPPVGVPLVVQWPTTYRHARRIVIGVVGATMMLLGAVMLVLPGPGWVVIGGGLAILATEFVWAKRWLALVRSRIDPLAERASRWLRWPRRGNSP